MYEFFLTLTRWPDFDHGQQRAVFAALKAVGLYDLMLLLSVSWNFPNGPMNNDYRWHQLNDAHDSIRKKFPARSCLLFQERYPQMMKELIDMNVELPGERDADLELWDYWCARSGNRNKHSRMMINRFMALVDNARMH